MQKGFSTTLIILGVLILLAVAGVVYYFGKSSTSNPENMQRACTLEAKLCPDGSSVGRTGPNCEFAQCPNSETANPDVIGKDWKIYKDELGLLSFKHPEDWIISEREVDADEWFMTDLGGEKYREIDLKKGNYRINLIYRLAGSGTLNATRTGIGSGGIPLEDISTGDYKISQTAYYTEGRGKGDIYEVLYNFHSFEKMGKIDFGGSLAEVGRGKVPQEIITEAKTIISSLVIY